MLRGRYKPRGNFFYKLWIKLFGYPLHVAARIQAYNVMKHFSLNKSHVIFDAGCGSGAYVIEIGLKEGVIVGVDVSKKAIYQASIASKLAKIDDTVSLIVADICNLPIKNDLFDQTICVDVLEHLAQDTKAIAEIARILKGDGILLLHTPQTNQVRCLFSRITIPDHVREGYEREALIRMLHSKNIETIETEETFRFFGTLSADMQRKFKKKYLHWIVFPIVYPLSKLDLFSKRRGNGLLIIAKKKCHE